MATERMQVLTKGFFKENPVFIIMLGLCPTLGVTTQVVNGIGMGLSVIFVLVFSNIFIAMLKNIIPNSVRIPAYIVIIAAFVTIVEMVMHAYAPSIYQALGIFLPLIVVNCIILARAEAFASKNPVLGAAIDGMGMGIGFTIALVTVSAFRELLGNGSLLGVNLLGQGFAASPVLVMILPPGGFLTLGLIIAGLNKLRRA